jgi:hypothetical protein
MNKKALPEGKAFLFYQILELSKIESTVQIKVMKC